MYVGDMKKNDWQGERPHVYLAPDFSVWPEIKFTSLS